MKKLKILFLVFLSLILVLSGCDSESGDNNSAAETEETEPEKEKLEEDKTQDPNLDNLNTSNNIIYSEPKDFSDSSWGTNIQIPADKFLSFSAGDKIVFELKALNFEPQYSKIKIYAVGSDWNELKDGSYSGGSYDDGVFINPPCTLSYTATESDAEKLRQNGLALNGYGFILTKIELQLRNSNSKSEEESGDQSSTKSSESETVMPKDEPAATAGTPYENHGKLHVSGAYLYDEHNEKYQLYGMSTHGLNFGDEFSRYVNKDAFKTLRDDWNTNCVRLVLYPGDYNGYCNGGDKAKLKQIMKNGIDYAEALGMYVIVDWHVHNASPSQYQDEAVKFLGDISAEYKNYGNVLYEICNEPTSSPWDSVIKPYAQKVIPVIRKNAPDAIIIVGTNIWSQDIEEAAKNPLDFKNVMYTFHFYAGTHKDSFRSRVESAVKGGLPVFVTEFGTCDASGNGGFNAAESEKWFELMKKYNISHFNWSLSNKGETASAIQSFCSKVSGWPESDLTESGKLVRSHFRSLEK